MTRADIRLAFHEADRAQRKAKAVLQSAVDAQAEADFARRRLASVAIALMNGEVMTAD